MKLNKKGFTLVELLAVIVVLAVLMLIAGTAVGPIITKANKANLQNEGIALVDAAKTAFQAETLTASDVVKTTSTVCFDLAWLNGKGYFTKGTSNGYSGSVLVTYNSSNSSYTYEYWISNGTYAFSKVAVDNKDYETNGVDGTSASATCGTETSGVIYCKGTSACAKKA